MYSVNNVSSGYENHKFTVIRCCDGEYWYYCSYDTIEKAQIACNELDNGLIVESQNIEVVYFAPSFHHIGRFL